MVCITKNLDKRGQKVSFKDFLNLNYIKYLENKLYNFAFETSSGELNKISYLVALLHIS